MYFCSRHYLVLLVNLNIVTSVKKPSTWKLYRYQWIWANIQVDNDIKNCIERWNPANQKSNDSFLMNINRKKFWIVSESKVESSNALNTYARGRNSYITVRFPLELSEEQKYHKVNNSIKNKVITLPFRSGWTVHSGYLIDFF